MQSYLGRVLFCVLAEAALGQTLVNRRLSASGGSASYRPPVLVRQPVEGAPVSYELSSVRVQTLGDGTHITQSTGLQEIWRDSQGRTRLERRFITQGVAAEAGPRVSPTAEISDPVAGFWYVLEKENRIAHRGRLPTPSAPPQPSEAGLDTGVVEDLGAQTINGVVTQGHRTTATVPLGAQGNDRPLVTTTETWISAELQITMLRKEHDPRAGDTTTLLRNFNRAEPDRSLFEPPADYRVVDETTQFAVSWGTPSPVRIGSGMSAPVVITKVEPQYTEEARRARIQGKVVVSLIVDEDGIPRNMRVTSSLDRGLDKKAIEAVSKWRFRPGQKDGKAVPTMANIELTFRLVDRPD